MIKLLQLRNRLATLLSSVVYVIGASIELLGDGIEPLGVAGGDDDMRALLSGKFRVHSHTASPASSDFPCSVVTNQQGADTGLAAPTPRCGRRSH